MLTAPKNSQLTIEHGLYDNVRAAARTADATARALLEQLSGLPMSDVEGDPDGLLKRARKPNFGGWLAHVAKARGCTRPVRLQGDTITVQATTGVVLDRFDTNDLPDRVLYKPCGTRIASRCPACAEVYRWDTYQLIKAGLAGGKGVPDTVTAHPAVFASFTAPSFGVVHTRDKHKPNKPCRARREKPVCPHGKPLWCNTIHREDDWRLGQPVCMECYDYQHHVVWNHLIGKLWSRTVLKLRRLMGATADGLIRIRYAKVAEYQRRGVVHLHALIRIDGVDPNDSAAIVPPPTGFDEQGNAVQLWTAVDLKEAVEEAARGTAIRTEPHPANSAGWAIAWGEQVNVKIVHDGLPGGELTERHVAGYLAKYATKATEITGLDVGRINSIEAFTDRSKHVNRLVQACWALGNLEPWDGLQHWAHRFGFPGHFSTKSRRYSTTLTALRQARQPQNRIKVTAIDGDPIELAADALDDETTLVIGRWTHVGNGWKTTGDAALAAMAADAARQRVPAGIAQQSQKECE